MSKQRVAIQDRRRADEVVNNVFLRQAVGYVGRRHAAETTAGFVSTSDSLDFFRLENSVLYCNRSAATAPDSNVAAST